MMNRRYFVTSVNSNGWHTWGSECSGFYPFQRVNHGLIKQWEEYAEQVTGNKSVIVNFVRIK